jgi:nicotinamidase-related amidase/type 1 glutamine amidotransferase
MQSHRRHAGSILALLLAGVFAVAARGDILTLHTRSRIPGGAADTNEWRVVEQTRQWEARHSAVVICDMWDRHWCPDATERVGEMAPRMNEVVKAARARGVFIIHCPSDTMKFYENHPGRKLARSAPKVETRVPLKGWCALNGEQEPPLPIDDSDEGCDGCPDCRPRGAWSRQHPAIEIAAGDAITDSAEAFYLMRQRGITNVMVMGVHANMCVLGRPFSIRQMVAQGQNVVLMRDLTDAMYNHRSRPWVSHFRGTELVVEHIEKYWCPSITSADLLGGEPFRFKGDVKKRIAFIIGENEYRTWETLPEFARKELAWRGYEISYVTASPRTDDYDFKHWEAIPNADLLVISARRRAAPRPMMDALRAHLAAGKPVVGIRTASHAFDPKDQDVLDERTWRHFDREVLGADYENHYGNGSETVVRQARAITPHAILNNVAPEFRSRSTLYRSRNPVNTLTPLLTGRTADGKSEVEPVAWINTGANRRVFYTSLGSPDDFADANFRRLLLNGILWALGDFVPPAGLGAVMPPPGARSP